MLILRVGTDVQKRKNSDKDIPHVNEVLSGSNISGIPQFLAEDIFGSGSVVRLENWQKENERELIYKYIENMRDSKNIFIIDELDILAPTVTKLSKYAEKFFDCREKYIDENGFLLGDLILKKDKKRAWVELMRLKNLKVAPVEMISSVSWKGKNARDMNLFFNTLLARHMEFNGEGEIYDELEKYILSLK